MSKRRPPRRPEPEQWLATGRYVSGAVHDRDRKQVIFGRPGELVPKRSEYVLGTLLTVGFMLAWAVWLAVALLLQATSDFNATLWGVAVPAAIAVLGMLVMPFVRQRLSADQRQDRWIREGRLVEVADTPVVERLARSAERARPGYFEQAEELARIEALREQADQLSELIDAAPAAGSHATDFVRQAGQVIGSLRRAADDREQQVIAYLTAVERG